jgi:hypothetical protein
MDIPRRIEVTDTVMAARMAMMLGTWNVKIEVGRAAGVEQAHDALDAQKGNY